jgi:hypothetical protein
MNFDRLRSAVTNFLVLAVLEWRSRHEVLASFYRQKRSDLVLGHPRTAALCLLAQQLLVQRWPI